MKLDAAMALVWLTCAFVSSALDRDPAITFGCIIAALVIIRTRRIR